ncbi:hypothetical protein AAG570_011729 [Ranatra chinensis]|uniref:Uncharacterized protein n=1 Tax=Ranatra chinensis TaxID=642074 RepID=A0ABD0YGP5_9HEMI
MFVICKGEEQEVPKEIGLNKNTAFSDTRKRDRVINYKGKQLLDICENCNLVELDGRILKDAGGEMTFVGKTGRSVIDFACVSLNMIRGICLFEIIPQAFSDHMPVSVFRVTAEGSEQPG